MIHVSLEDVIVEEHEPFLRNIHSLNRCTSTSFCDTKETALYETRSKIETFKLNLRRTDVVKQLVKLRLKFSNILYNADTV